MWAGSRTGGAARLRQGLVPGTDPRGSFSHTPQIRSRPAQRTVATTPSEERGMLRCRPDTTGQSIASGQGPRLAGWRPVRHPPMPPSPQSLTLGRWPRATSCPSPPGRGVGVRGPPLCHQDKPSADRSLRADLRQHENVRWHEGDDPLPNPRAIEQVHVAPIQRQELFTPAVVQHE